MEESTFPKKLGCVFELKR